MPIERPVTTGPLSNDASRAFPFHGREARAPSGHARTYYAATAKGLQDHPPLSGAATCDVAIIGGGLTGLSCALALAERNYDVVLIEARRLGWGASGRNGGQLLSGQRVDQQSLETRHGAQIARQMWDLAQAAKQEVRTRIDQHAIECGLMPGALSAAAKPAHFRELQAEADHLGTVYDYPHLTVVPPAAMGDYVASRGYHGGVWDADGGHLHPLNYALGLAQAAEKAGARLFENTPALSVTKNAAPKIRTPQGTIKARAVVLACNAYHTGLMPEIDKTVLPINSFVGVTRPLVPELARALLPRGGCVADTRFILDYYRLTPDHRLLFGGGESYAGDLPRDVAPIILKRIRKVFPQLLDAGLEFAWGGRLAVTRSRMPHIGRVGPNRYVAVGFSGQGLAITTQAGSVIAEAIAGTAERFDVYDRIKPIPLPGGPRFRRPLMVLAMAWAALRDML